jgi:hypothetical protein
MEPENSSRTKLILGLLLTAVFMACPVQSAILIDRWLAEDLLVLDDGDPVGSWTSANNRTATAATGLQPTFVKGATPAGGPVVRFNRHWMTSPGSPLAGMAAFSIAYVFKADAAGANNNAQWYGKSGIVDAEQGGVTADWGTVIDEQGRVGIGTGSPDRSTYSSGNSVVDGNFHAVVFTWGGGAQTIYLDDRPAVSLSEVTTAARNSAGFSFGAIHTGEGGAGRRFVGDLAEVRFYNGALTPLQAGNVISELTETHIVPNRPIIRSFTASTNEIMIGSFVTLSWNVTNSTALSIAPGVGTVQGPEGSIVVSPSTTTTYTLTASNSFGLRSASVTVIVDPGIPVAMVFSTNTMKNTAVAITLRGTDPNHEPLTYAIVDAPSQGTLSGTAPNVTYTPNPEFIGNDQFTFKVNDGNNDSPPATVSIRVIAPPSAPSAIVLSTTNIFSGAGPGSFLAGLRTIDVNPEDTHTYELVSGFGDNAHFTIHGSHLLAGGSFSGGIGASFSIRLRTTDQTGLSFEQTFQLQIVRREHRVVINEVHYNPRDNTIREEFIELFNPGEADVDLSLWRIRNAVEYVFPEGTIIPAGGFIVVAEDPATILSSFGVMAFGPWQGRLDNDGETISLRDANGNRVNEVSYRSEFPWPIAANGGGGSMELINPSLNNDLGSSWKAPANPAAPSPGAVNHVYAENAAPNIRQVRHSPKKPSSAESVLITARVTDPEGVASVLLHYQVVAPGNYIPAFIPLTHSELMATPERPPNPNPAFENPANWITVPLTDDGAGGDAVAGDDIYSVVLPPHANRTLVRYRITVTDTLGATRRAPFEDDPSLNFAYFVYDGIPAYEGFSPEVLETLPVYFLLSRPQDVEQCTAYNSAFQLPQTIGGVANEARFTFNWPATLVYDGVVYDHVRYRLRGANGRYQPGKRNWRVRFNRGHYFQAHDQDGNPYPTKWSSLNTGKGQSNRQTLTFALNEVINYYLFNQIGVPAPFAHYFHFRVITGGQEAPGKYTGDFWGLSWAQENYDVRFLEAHNLPKGNVYKLINSKRTGVEQQRYQAPFAVKDGSDHDNIEDHLTGFQSTEWLLAHVNYPNWYLFHALSEAVRHYDFWPNSNKNGAWYFEPVYTPENNFLGRMWTLPWDTDSTWGPTWNSGHDVVYNGIFPSSASGGDSGQNPELQKEYRNVVREVRELLFQPDQILPVIDAFAAQIQAFIPADLERWRDAPANTGSYSSLSAPGPGLTSGLAGYVQDLKQFAFSGGTWPGGGVGAGGQAARLDVVAADNAIPARPVMTYAGPPGFPVDNLVFESSAFSDPQGPQTFAAMQWRVAEITPPNTPVTDPSQLKLEWHADWDSGELATFTSQITIPGVRVKPGHLYRARVRHKDDTGRWSRWSAPVEFVPYPVDMVANLRSGLVISEIMYNPPNRGAINGDDLEFLELKNMGTSPLNLSGLYFSEGINFTFPNGSMLLPGGFFLLARNAEALQTIYPGVIVHGVYGGRLDNGGETITIMHPHGAVIVSVTYDDDPPWPLTADGFGFSLVFDSASGRYRASSGMGGTPGADDPGNFIPPVVVNEALSASAPPQTDAIELHNPTDAPADIGGWYLTDSAAFPWKYRIPAGTIIPAGGYLVFDESHFNSPGAANGFALSALGEEVFLFSGNANFELTGYSHGFAFGGAERGVSFGRHINSVGEEQFPPQSALTLGAPNSGPRVGPVVINEIQYHPAEDGDEFIELLNITAAPAPLFDPERPANTWRLRGLNYTFPENITLEPNELLLLVPIDPETFRAKHDVPAGVRILGPYSGALQNRGEWIELLSPATPTGSGVPYLAVDQVRYSARAPWPAAASALGPSLQRLVPGDYGNDPVNWTAAFQTPGRLFAPAAPPVILSAPTGGSMIGFGEVNLEVTATGAGPLFYQWWFNGEPIPGGTNAVLTLKNVQLTQAGHYNVEVFSASGSASSVPAYFHVLLPANITMQPQGQNVRPGASVTFSVSAISTTPIAYQWRLQNVDLPGATNATLVLNNVQVADGGVYQVVVTDAVGSRLSVPAMLNVLVDPVVTRAPLSQTVVAGSDVTFYGEFIGSPLPFTVEWRRGTVIMTSRELSRTNDSFTLRNVQPSDTATNYRLVVKNLARPFGIASTFALTVLPDADGDGMPDAWELAHGFDPENPNDRDLDADGDGMSNWEEYIAGTDPRDPRSYLKIEQLSLMPVVTLQFQSVSNRAYRVEYRDALGSEDWQALADVLPESSNRLQTVTDRNPSGESRYYRLLIPGAP